MGHNEPVTQTEPDVVVARPHRVRIVAVIAAVAIVAVFSAVATALTGSTDPGPGAQAVFRPGDQAAMIGLGVLGALIALAFTRPRVRADRDGVLVRNVIGETLLPWSVVREVRFDRGHPWASLELENDDTVSVLAIQAADRERALTAITGLRRLHEAARLVPPAAGLVK